MKINQCNKSCFVPYQEDFAKVQYLVDLSTSICGYQYFDKFADLQQYLRFHLQVQSRQHDKLHGIKIVLESDMLGEKNESQ